MKRHLARVGWTSLAFWSSGGLLLEMAHAFKWAPFFSSELTHWLLRLAHAHGIGLGLLSVVVAQSGLAHWPPRARPARVVTALLTLATLALPLGFAGGACGATETDPGPLVFLAPCGGLALLVGLCWLAVAAWRHDPADDPASPPLSQSGDSPER